ILMRERLREGGTFAKVRVQYLIQLGVRDAEWPPADSRHTFDSRVLKRVTQGVSADHAGGAHEHKMFSSCGRNTHESMRPSIQSTYRRRSAKSQVPFTL